MKKYTKSVLELGGKLVDKGNGTNFYWTNYQTGKVEDVVKVGTRYMHINDYRVSLHGKTYVETGKKLFVTETA